MMIGSPALAHDFWIQPTRFAVASNEPLPFTFLVGHGAARQRWGVSSDRVLRFADISAAGHSDRRAILHTQSGDNDGSLVLASPGTHVIVLETGPALSVLPALRFNDYLKAEGLTPAIEQRTRTGKTGAEGREYYSRRAKLLVQVGPVSAQPQVTQPTGLKLEIVPQKSPYQLKPGESLPVQILYEGQPLSGATVKLNNLDFDAAPIAQILTDPSGLAIFTVPLRGHWQLNVIWTRPINNTKADYETLFSSLTFGFDSPR
jgi:uncharacterized GH25 family protein